MSAEMEENRDALRNSGYFTVLGSKAFLNELRNADPKNSELLRLAKLWKKPTLVIVIALLEAEEKELLSFFSGHDVRRVFRVRGVTPQLTDELDQYVRDNPP